MTGLSLASRGFDIARELGMVLPRTVAGLNESTGWSPASPRGVRQFGEVMLDELALTGFSLLGGAPPNVQDTTGESVHGPELYGLRTRRSPRLGD